MPGVEPTSKTAGPAQTPPAEPVTPSANGNGNGHATPGASAALANVTPSATPAVPDAPIPDDWIDWDLPTETNKAGHARIKPGPGFGPAASGAGLVFEPEWHAREQARELAREQARNKNTPAGPTISIP